MRDAQHIGGIGLTQAQESALGNRLRAAGLRTTRPRLVLAHLLFANGNRHVTAEKLFEEAGAVGVSVSLATVYNTLNQFCDAGLLREVIVDHARNYFDTNLHDHHHFYIENEARLIDIDADAVDVARLPQSPDGYDVDMVEVIIRLNKATE